MKISHSPKIDLAQLKQTLAAELKQTGTSLSLDETLAALLKLAAKGAKASERRPSGLSHPHHGLRHTAHKHSGHHLPPLKQRAAAMETQAKNLSAQVSNSQASTGVAPASDPTPAPTPGPTGGGLADPSLFRDGGLSADQQTALDGITPKDGKEYKRTEAQFKLQNHAETMAFLSNYFKMLHDTSMSIIANIR